MKNVYVIAAMAVLSLLSGLVMAAGSAFPGRAKYPQVPIYSLSQLKQNLSKVVLVDARSRYEFDTLRIKGAINIPVASKTFETQVKALRAKTSEPIVFYCNGTTCMKSYIATKKAMAAHVADVQAYDGGMFEWAESYPNYSELFDKGTLKPGDIISLQRYRKHLLSADDFGNKAYEMGKQSVILDVRDKYQRGATGLFPGIEQWVSLDHERKIHDIIEEAKKDNETLFVYDEVGHQVQWLQYALVRAKMNNYYFMKGGAEAYFSEMMKSMGIKSDLPH